MDASSDCKWCNRPLRDHAAESCGRADLAVQRETGKPGYHRLVFGHQAGYYFVDPRSFTSVGDANRAATETFGFAPRGLPRN